MKLNKFIKLSPQQLYDEWRLIIDGQSCGCPDCIRDLLDEIAPKLLIIKECK